MPNGYAATQGGGGGGTSRDLLIVALVVLPLVVLEVATDAKPMSHLSCWVRATKAEQFGGRERVWNQETGECDYGFREYR
jgi:hypothetical protein